MFKRIWNLKRSLPYRKSNLKYRYVRSGRTCMDESWMTFVVFFSYFKGRGLRPPVSPAVPGAITRLNPALNNDSWSQALTDKLFVGSSCYRHWRNATAATATLLWQRILAIVDHVSIALFIGGISRAACKIIKTVAFVRLYREASIWQCTYTQRWPIAWHQSHFDAVIGPVLKLTFVQYSLHWRRFVRVSPSCIECCNIWDVEKFLVFQCSPELLASAAAVLLPIDV